MNKLLVFSMLYYSTKTKNLDDTYLFTLSAYDVTEARRKAEKHLKAITPVPYRLIKYTYLPVENYAVEEVHQKVERGEISPFELPPDFERMKIERSAILAVSPPLNKIPEEIVEGIENAVEYTEGDAMVAWLYRINEVLKLNPEEQIAIQTMLYKARKMYNV